MFPRDLYEIVHLIGIALTMAALGATALHALEELAAEGHQPEPVLEPEHACKTGCRVLAKTVPQQGSRPDATLHPQLRERVLDEEDRG